MFNPGQEAVCLHNIQQVTFPSFGFEKAGEAYFSPDGGSIIFQAVPHGKKYYQMYTMDLRVGIPFMVSTGRGCCTCGFYKPDGTKILFASSHESPFPIEDTAQNPSTKYSWELIPYMNDYEAELDGSCLQRITSGSPYHAECAYSPNGTEIVYASNESGSMNLYICNADGTNPRQITFSQNGYNGGPFFFPDGEWLVFRTDREDQDLLQLYDT